MFRIQQAIENGLGCGLFVAAVAGVVAWNTREKCLDGVGLLPAWGVACPSSKTLVIVVVVLSLVAGVGATLQAMRRRDDASE